MKLNYNVTGEDRKQMVAIISRETGVQEVYTRMPVCAYVIDGLKVSKTGEMSWDERTEEALIGRITAALTAAGFAAPPFLQKGVAKNSLSANGKSNIMREIEKHAGERMIIVGDGAAFGAEMDPVYQYERMHPEGIFLFLPESFEWLLMSAGVVTDEEIAEILDDPSDYVESRDFFSWEQFFTYLLEKKTRGTPAQYNKKELARYYLQDENVRKIVMAIEKKSDF